MGHATGNVREFWAMKKDDQPRCVGVSRESVYKCNWALRSYVDKACAKRLISVI